MTIFAKLQTIIQKEFPRLQVELQDTIDHGLHDSSDRKDGQIRITDDKELEIVFYMDDDDNVINYFDPTIYLDYADGDYSTAMDVFIWLHDEGYFNRV